MPAEPVTPAAAARPPPNCRCRDCNAALRFQPPEQRRPIVDAVNWVADRWWARILALAVAIGIAAATVWWVLLGLLLLVLALYIIRPPAYRPRCPKCGSTDVVEIYLPA